MLQEIDNNELQFWQEIESKQGIVINIIKSDFIKFLENRGYRKLIQNKDFLLVKIVENSIVVIIEVHSVREEVKNYLRSINRKDVWEIFMGQDYLCKKFIEGLDSVHIDFDYGTENNAIFFYKNGVLNLTAQNFNLTPYTKYEGYVWEDQILNRNFSQVLFEDCEFKKFCWNIAGQKADRIEPLETLIGYLLHTYKDPSLTKAIILIDENIDMENNKSEGGTGKSLIAESIKRIVPTLRKNGKLLKANDKFFFADVESFHKVIVFDDVKIDFSFEALYSMITGDMPIEKKYKNPTVMDFKDVPKVIITSNYIVMGTGGNSENRRKIVFEVNSHYRENPSIIEEFGHRFFDDWTESEWLKFDNYLMYCVQQFLNNGLIEAESINENKNRLIQETNTDFVGFMEVVLENPSLNNGDIKDNRVRFDKAILLQMFIAENPEHTKLITPNSFKKWIDIYAENKEIKFEHQKSNGKSYVIFHHVIIQENENLLEYS